MTHRTPRLAIAALLAATATTAATSASAQFVVGDVFYASTTGEIFNITGGGDFTGQVWIDTTEYSVGQFAWSVDLDTMYLSLYSTNEVIAIDPQGNYTTHATGLSGPSGLLMTRDGVLLVAEFATGEITDITLGGDMTNVAPLTTGLSGPRDMTELADGTVLIADQVLDGIYDVLYPGGGTVGQPFAGGLNLVRGLTVTQNGTLYTTSEQFIQGAFQFRVFDITAGGDFTGASPFAFGRDFFSLTETPDGKLLSGELFGFDVWDITAGGDFTVATPYATGLIEGESPLDTVPPPVCGSGAIGPGEECDDGNDSNEDDCTNDCTTATCGDGFVWAGMEECDDGNTDDGDGCSAVCEMEAIGTGGMGGMGGAGGAGGVGGSGGSGGFPMTGTTVGSGSSAGGSGGDSNGVIEEDSGCGCRTVRTNDSDGWWAALALMGLGLARRRRR